MINYVSNSFLCSNSFSGPAGCVDQAISEGINAPIANELEANLGIAGSIIAGVVCTALKITSVTFSTFVFLATLPFYCISLDSDGDDPLEPPVDLTKKTKVDISPPPKIIVDFDQDIPQKLELVKSEIRKKRVDDPEEEFTRLEKLGCLTPEKITKLNSEISSNLSLNSKWLKRIYIEAITISTIFNRTHYPFLHAQSERLSVIPYLLKELAKRENRKGETLFNTHNIQLLRDPKSSFPNGRLSTFLQSKKRDGSINNRSFDRIPDVKKCLVAADVNPFNKDNGESAYYFCSLNMNVIPDQRETISNVLRARFNLTDKVLNILANRIHSITDSIITSHRCGNLFLYLLPKGDILNYTYLSRSYGIPYSDSESRLASDTLDGLEHDISRPGEKNIQLDFTRELYQTQSQYRLYIPAIQEAMESDDPTKRPIVYLLTTTPKWLRKKIKGEIRDAVDMAEAEAAAAEAIT